MAILATDCSELVPIGRVRVRSVGLGRLAIVPDPFPRDVAQVGVDRLGGDALQIDDPGLDHHPA